MQTKTQSARPTKQISIQPNRTPSDPAPDISRGPNGLLAGVGLLAVAVAALMAAVGDVFPEPIVLLTLMGTAAWIASRRQARWPRWVLVVLLLVFIGANLPFAVSDLAHPESWAPFAATLLVMATAAVTAVLAVASALERSLPAMRMLSGALALGVVGAVAGLLAAAGVAQGVVQPGDAAITAADFTYPTQVTADGTAGILVTNADRSRHTFVIAGAVEPVELPGGAQVRVPLNLDPGEYRFFCDVIGHEAMTGVLTVP